MSHDPKYATNQEVFGWRTPTCTATWEAPSILVRALTNGGPTIPPMLPSSVVPRAKMRVRFLHSPLTRSLLVVPEVTAVQLAGTTEVGTPVKPLHEILNRCAIPLKCALEKGKGEGHGQNRKMIVKAS